MLKFCRQDAHLMVTAEAITLVKGSAMSSTDYNYVLATKQPSLINAQNSSLEVSGS